MVDVIIQKPDCDCASRPHELADQLVDLLNKNLGEGNEHAHEFAQSSLDLSRGEWVTVIKALRAQPK